MSKIKAAYEKAQEVKEYYNWGYEEYKYQLACNQQQLQDEYTKVYNECMANFIQPNLLTEEDIIAMEKSYGNSSKPTFVNACTSVATSSLNNHNYNNIKGKVS